MRRLATLELHLSIEDTGEHRQRWNGDPMASREAQKALLDAVEAACATLRDRGYHAGYGIVAAEDIP